MQILLAPLNGLLGLLEFLGGVALLMRDTAVALPAAVMSRRGRRLGWENLWAQMNRVGVQSIPIVFLVMFCIGSILALQMYPTLHSFGQATAIPNIIAVAVFRELGPLVSAVVLTGFAGASIAAEIGTMTVSEEIEALEAQAIAPVRFLVVPRVLATTVMMVCLALVGDVAGTVGGLVISSGPLDMGQRMFLHRVFSQLMVQDFVTGLFKAGVFGVLISSLACYLGLNVTNGAQGVGQATTRTVVYTIVALIIVDLMFTAVFFALNL
ncbi:MAG: MlaE family ABC transporter permease [Tepidisphaerales bacterium]